MLSLTQIKFCAEECQRQRNVGPMGVYHMSMALAWLLENKPATRRVTLNMIFTIGLFVEPENSGLRCIPVYFENGDFAINPDNVYDALESLCQYGDELPADQFYKELMTIHPFVDGNGRMGAIIWNFLNNTLENPTIPPNMFN